MSIRSKDARLVLGAPPRANLLPQEVRAERQARAVRHALRLVFVAVVLVAICGIGAGYLVAQQSAVQLQGARARTTTLFAQQSKYGDITAARTRLTSTSVAMKSMSGAGIQWKAYLEDISATLPDGMSIVSVAIDSAAPGTVYASPTSPLQGSRVATLTFQVTGAQLGSVRSWLDALRGLPGYVDAEADSITTGPDGDLLANVTLHVGTKAYTVPARTTPAASATPTATPSAEPTPSGSATPSGAVPSDSAPTPSSSASAADSVSPSPSTEPTSVVAGGASR